MVAFGGMKCVLWLFGGMKCELWSPGHASYGFVYEIQVWSCKFKLCFWSVRDVYEIQVMVLQILNLKNTADYIL
jgi:hypothetical protein